MWYMIIGYDSFLDENIDIQYPILEKHMRRVFLNSEKFQVRKILLDNFLWFLRYFAWQRLSEARKRPRNYFHTQTHLSVVSERGAWMLTTILVSPKTRDILMTCGRSIFVITFFLCYFTYKNWTNNKIKKRMEFFYCNSSSTEVWSELSGVSRSGKNCGGCWRFFWKIVVNYQAKKSEDSGDRPARETLKHTL
jgi:hypothetical protein